ncbi:MAG: DMT family transporter [Parvularculaceae bacterium]
MTIENAKPAAPAISEKLQGHLAMALFALLISVSFFIGKRAAPHIDPGALNAVRYYLAIPILGAFAFAFTPKAARPALMRPKSVWRYFVLGGLMGLYFIMMFVSLRLTTSVATGAVLTLMPLMSAIFGSILLRQPAGPVVIGSLLLAAAGTIWVIFRGDVGAILSFDVGTGEMLFFIGVVAHALHNPLVRKLNRGETTIAFTFWTVVATGICLTIYALPAMLKTDWLHLPAIVWICVLYLATFTTSGSYFLLQFGMLRIPAGKAISYMLLTPTYVIVLEGLAGTGWVSPQVMAGALVTVLGLVILIASPDK